MPIFYYSASYKDRHGRDFIAVNHLIEDAENNYQALDIAEKECAMMGIKLLDVRSFKSIIK